MNTNKPSYPTANSIGLVCVVRTHKEKDAECAIQRPSVRTTSWPRTICLGALFTLSGRVHQFAWLDLFLFLAFAISTVLGV